MFLFSHDHLSASDTSAFLADRTNGRAYVNCVCLSIGSRIRNNQNE